MNIFFRHYLEEMLNKLVTMSDSSFSPQHLHSEFQDRRKEGREESPGMLWEEVDNKHSSRWQFPMHAPPPTVGFLWHDGDPIGKRWDSSPLVGSLLPLLRSFFPEEPCGTSSHVAAGQGLYKQQSMFRQLDQATCLSFFKSCVPWGPQQLRKH